MSESDGSSYHGYECYNCVSSDCDHNEHFIDMTLDALDQVCDESLRQIPIIDTAFNHFFQNTYSLSTELDLLRKAFLWKLKYNRITCDHPNLSMQQWESSWLYFHESIKIYWKIESIGKLLLADTLTNYTHFPLNNADVPIRVCKSIHGWFFDNAYTYINNKPVLKIVKGHTHIGFAKLIDKYTNISVAVSKVVLEFTGPMVTAAIPSHAFCLGPIPPTTVYTTPSINITIFCYLLLSAVHRKYIAYECLLDFVIDYSFGQNKRFNNEFLQVTLDTFTTANERTLQRNLITLNFIKLCEKYYQLESDIKFFIKRRQYFNQLVHLLS